MFADQPTIISSNASSPSGSGNQTNRKKTLIIIGLGVLVVIILAAAVFWFIKQPKKAPASNTPTTNSATTTNTGTLPNFENLGDATSTAASSSFSNLAIEYLSFADFYKSPDNNFSPQFKDYSLPLNVKIDVMNYYDVSRKLNLDPGLSGLNNNGFAVIDNPWIDKTDFYSLYANLDQQQIPMFISSDFIAYYYQSILKKTFKDVEANIFYDNLWSITNDMYNTAKTRYEARLASLGSVNDSLLEGERLEVAFFATALELMKPGTNQIAPKGAADEVSKFTAADANKFSFSIPDYLRADVLREEKLIRDANAKIKSPVLLYTRNYSDFTVPVDYHANAKLNNFYLTTKWLNSVWPVNYKDKNCPDCLLDYPDWRLNLIAASFISKDFSSLPDLKNKWARIYKVMAFFKGLREDLGYVQYRDSLATTFGADYQLDSIFSDSNAQAKDNLEKMRAKIMTYNFPAVQGGLDRSDPTNKSQIGLRLLAGSYWPNDYIFSHLAYPAVTDYLGSSTPPASNITFCPIYSIKKRCNGFVFDPINLVYSISDNSYFSENTNYANYHREVGNLQTQLNTANVWHSTNYWTTLSQVRAYLEMPKSNSPLFTRSLAWHDQALGTAAAAWTNLQLPLEPFSLNQIFKGQGLDTLSRWNENSYVDPNYTALNEMIAVNNMLLKMFNALQIDQEVSPVMNNLEVAGNNLTMLRDIVLKELSGQDLSADDNQNIADFAKTLTVTPVEAKYKRLNIYLSSQKTGFNEDISRLKLMVVIHQVGDSKVMSVGPVWSYKESH